MKVMQVQLDEATYAEVEQRAYLERKSLTAVVRDALAHHFKCPEDRAGANGGLAFVRPEKSLREDQPLPAKPRVKPCGLS